MEKDGSIVNYEEGIDPKELEDYKLVNQQNNIAAYLHVPLRGPNTCIIFMHVLHVRFINPRHACAARVIVLCVSVCLW